MPQFADVPDVFGHGQVGIEAERLREVSGARTRVASRPSENLRCAAGGFHHSGENLKCGGLARAVGADQAEDFPALHLEGNSAHGLESAVAFLEAANINGSPGSRGVARREIFEVRGGSVHCAARLCGGHAVPLVRISPSAGMPGLAKPIPCVNCTLTPTTCFTRSSRK